jgi:hypothetical protein
VAGGAGSRRFRPRWRGNPEDYQRNSVARHSS